MQTTQPKYKFNDFIPLIGIFAIIVLLTALHQIYYGFDLMHTMRIFMAFFFLIFGLFKVINIKAFATAYAEYDLISQKFFWYGYLYPFLELGLGLAYFINWQPNFINIFTLILMLISALGVYIELRKGKTITCACLGVVFKIPMTYVTLAEDLLMAAMALIMVLL